jgi:hypothetical protein
LEKLAPNNLFTATVGPFDAIYVPFGWAIGERVMNGIDVIGFRLPVFVRESYDVGIKKRMDMVFPVESARTQVTQDLCRFMMTAVPATEGTQRPTEEIGKTGDGGAEAHPGGGSSAGSSSTPAPLAEAAERGKKPSEGDNLPEVSSGEGGG